MADRENVIAHFQATDEAFGDTCKWRFVRVDILKDAIALLKAQEPGWISVKERLPERSGKYLIVAVDHGKIKHVTTSMFGKFFYMTGRMTHWKVTHWMPLPEPPKEENT